MKIIEFLNLSSVTKLKFFKIKFSFVPFLDESVAVNPQIRGPRAGIHYNFATESESGAASGGTAVRPRRDRTAIDKTAASGAVFGPSYSAKKASTGRRVKSQTARAAAGFRWRRNTKGIARRIVSYVNR